MVRSQRWVLKIVGRVGTTTTGTEVGMLGASGQGNYDKASRGSSRCTQAACARDESNCNPGVSCYKGLYTSVYFERRPQRRAALPLTLLAKFKSVSISVVNSFIMAAPDMVLFSAGSPSWNLAIMGDPLNGPAIPPKVPLKLTDIS